MLWQENSETDVVWEDIDEDEQLRDDDRTISDAEDQNDRANGCKHYKRKCKVYAPCCSKLVWCRRCHDETDPSHEMDRKAVTKIQCFICQTEQPPSANCVSCKVQFAETYCETCKLWDNEGTKKGIFHCDDCGICRVGGRENFFHCSSCGACYGLALKDNHRCIEKAMQSDCPVCLENLFTSTKVVSVLPCGHTIHHACLEILRRDGEGLRSMRCPICQRTLLQNPQAVWDHLRRTQRLYPLDPPDRKKVEISCHDCCKKSYSWYYPLGIRCYLCGSFNTAQTGVAPLDAEIIDSSDSEPPNDQETPSDEDYVTESEETANP